MAIATMVVVARHQPKEVVAWGSDLGAAREQGKREGKPVLLYFTATWCGPCQAMKHTTFADRGVADLLASKYEAVKLDIDANQELAAAHHVESIPTFIVLGDDGVTEMRRESGYMDEDDFARWLKG